MWWNECLSNKRSDLRLLTKPFCFIYQSSPNWISFFLEKMTEVLVFPQISWLHSLNSLWFSEHNLAIKVKVLWDWDLEPPLVSGPVDLYQKTSASRTLLNMCLVVAAVVCLMVSSVLYLSLCSASFLHLSAYLQIWMVNTIEFALEWK